jgi:magnesium-transporting ATPase (P-type)
MQAPIIIGGHNFQHTNSPDIDLDRDLNFQDEAETILGIETTQLNQNKKFQINISTIIISALIFLAILAWFDFIQTTFYLWLIPDDQIDGIPSSAKLWYALFITVIIIILIVIVYLLLMQ